MRLPILQSVPRGLFHAAIGHTEDALRLGHVLPVGVLCLGIIGSLKRAGLVRETRRKQNCVKNGQRGSCSHRTRLHILKSCHLKSPAETMNRSPPAAGVWTASTCACARSRTSIQEWLQRRKESVTHPYRYRSDTHSNEASYSPRTIALYKNASEAFMLSYVAPSSWMEGPNIHGGLMTTRSHPIGPFAFASS